MPLINSIFKSFVRQQMTDYLVIEELETTDLYEYEPQDSHQYIEGETLHIRVDGLQKNYELNRNDRLEGPVIQSDLNPESIPDISIEFKDHGEWNPLYLYGKEASDFLFPYHDNDKSYRILEFLHPELTNEESVNDLNKAREHLGNKQFRRAELVLSQLLSKDFNSLECLRLLGFMHFEQSQLEITRKYFELGIKLIESTIQKEDKEAIFPGKNTGNFIFLSFYLGIANAWEFQKENKKALEYYKRCYRLDPFDYMGARMGIHRLSNEEMPALTAQEHPAIDPYAFADRFKMPIRDSYNPNSKVNPSDWMDWSKMYQLLLIFQAHKDTPYFLSMKQEQIQSHLMIHQIAETSVALNDPPKIRWDLARIVAAGSSRHDAVHQIGQRLMTHINQIAEDMKSKQESDSKHNTE